MKNKNLIITTFLLVVFTVVSFSANAGRYSRGQARKTIEQTSYIINQAYEIASYYSYWQTNNVSRAMYYNNYAQDLYFYRSYRSAIRYSLVAREYALDVIDNCDDYWEFFYYTYFGWSNRYGYNYNFSYRSGYMDGYYDGYYARYCARHNHDYRQDPYQNMNNRWYDNNIYNDVVNNSYYQHNTSSVALGRGESSRIERDSNGGLNSSIGRKNYTNITTDNYFSQTELALLKDAPSAAVVEDEFKRKNPTINFSDENLSRNTDVIKRNTTNASAFISRSGNKEAISRANISKPTSITLQNGNTISGRTSELKDIKLNNNQKLDTKKVQPELNRGNTPNRNVNSVNNNASRSITPTRNTTTRENSSNVSPNRNMNTDRPVRNNFNNNNTRVTTPNKRVAEPNRTTTIQSNRTNDYNRISDRPSRATTTPSRNTTTNTNRNNNSNSRTLNTNRNTNVQQRVRPTQSQNTSSQRGNAETRRLSR